LVAETGDLGWRPLGSLAGMGLSEVVLYALRRAGSLLGAARRVRESIVWVMWLWCCWRGGRVKSIVGVELEDAESTTAHGPPVFCCAPMAATTLHITSNMSLVLLSSQITNITIRLYSPCRIPLISDNSQCACCSGKWRIRRSSQKLLMLTDMDSRTCLM
jgi:hypothetical protein